MKIAYYTGTFYRYEHSGWAETISDGVVPTGFIHEEVVPQLGDCVWSGNYHRARQALPSGLTLNSHRRVISSAAETKEATWT